MKMKKLRRGGVLLSILLPLTVNAILGQTSSSTSTNTLVLPKEVEFTAGDSSLAPFTAGSNEPEQAYGPSEFASFPLNVIHITEVAFRIDEVRATSPNAVLRGAFVELSAFRGTLAELVCCASSNLTLCHPYPSAPSAQSDVRFSGQLGGFDVRFPCDFAYDRRSGPLIVAFRANEVDGQYALDAQTLSDAGTDQFCGESQRDYFISDRGVFIFWGATASGATFYVGAGMPVTRFTFRTPDAEINGVRILDNHVQIDFTILGNPDFIQAESAADAAGPYLAEVGTRLKPFSEGKLEASIPVSTKNRFFRIRLN